MRDENDIYLLNKYSKKAEKLEALNKEMLDALKLYHKITYNIFSKSGKDKLWSDIMEIDYTKIKILIEKAEKELL
jgi:hypothetical protein